MDVQTLVMEKFGLTAKRQGKEWHSPCPDCGGRDRLIWFGDSKGNGFCRQCLKTFWLLDLQKLDPLEKLEREQRAREYEAQQRGLQAQLLRKFQSRAQDYLRGWHDAMTFAAREWWHAQGITDDSIDSYGLGACKYPLTDEQTGERRDYIAFTIPIRDPVTQEIVNMQYRLENPPEGVGKYRQEKNLPARSFYALPHTNEDVIIVEGAKKALVLNQTLERNIQVVGLPGITPSDRLIDELACYKRKWFIPDPDVTDATLQRFKRLANLRLVRLPVKPDDAITRYGMNRKDLREWIVQTRF